MSVVVVMLTVVVVAVVVEVRKYGQCGGVVEMVGGCSLRYSTCPSCGLAE